VLAASTLRQQAGSHLGAETETKGRV